MIIATRLARNEKPFIEDCAYFISMSGVKAML